MAQPRGVFHEVVINPTVTTSYNISTYCGTTLNTADEYEIDCETAYVTCTAKSATAFTLTVVVQSPVVVNVARLKFKREVKPA